MNSHSHHAPRRDSSANRAGQTQTPLFALDRPLKQLVDELAEAQADALSRIGSAQLRRFFGEIKELYRHFQTLVRGTHDLEERQTIYAEQIEPRFKMIRSKVAYAKRPYGQSTIPKDFAAFLDHGIKVSESAEDFEKFVRHLEAVVGFLYGLGKVTK